MVEVDQQLGALFPPLFVTQYMNFYINYMIMIQYTFWFINDYVLGYCPLFPLIFAICSFSYPFNVKFINICSIDSCCTIFVVLVETILLESWLFVLWHVIFKFSILSIFRDDLFHFLFHCKHYKILFDNCLIRFHGSQQCMQNLKSLIDNFSTLVAILIFIILVCSGVPFYIALHCVKNSN